MSATDETGVKPVVLVLRWRHRVDVCAVLANRAVGWIARDVLEAIEGDPGDYADDPGHAPLVIAEHVHARTWTLDQANRIMAGSVRANGLLAWMHDREQTVADVGYGSVVRYGTIQHRPDDQTFSIQTAAGILDTDPVIDMGRQRLFDLLRVRGWADRHGGEYSPAQTAVDAGLVAVVPRRLPHSGDLWPQIVLTRTGLAELHRLLGGTDPTVIPQEPHR